MGSLCGSVVRAKDAAGFVLESSKLNSSLLFKINAVANGLGGGVAELVSARLSEKEIPSLILSDFNVCFNIPLIHVAIAVK